MFQLRKYSKHLFFSFFFFSQLAIEKENMQLFTLIITTAFSVFSLEMRMILEG